MRFIHTYYESVPGMQRHEIHDIWCRSWELRNWIPVIHTRLDAEVHPLFRFYDKAIRRLPTINNPEYEAACWRRWLVADLVGGYWCDDDVVNVSLDCGAVSSNKEHNPRPCPVAWAIRGQPNCGLMHFHRNDHISEFISRVLAGSVPVLMEMYPAGEGRLGKHTSDMLLWEELSKTWPARFLMPSDHVVSYFHERRNTPLVHCSSNSVHAAGVPKVEAMASLLSPT